jgi:hypothetical protein
VLRVKEDNYPKLVKAYGIRIAYSPLPLALDPRKYINELAAEPESLRLCHFPYSPPNGTLATEEMFWMIFIDHIDLEGSVNDA